MDLTAFRQEKEKLDKAIAKHGRKAVVDAFTEFFKSHPEVEAVRWTQYTPHFNDGDACEFSRNEFYVSGANLPLKKDASSDYGDDFYSDYDLSVKMVGSLEKTFRDTDDLFIAAFGDGVQVTVTPDGKFEVEDYDHD